ncbi:HD-GYP domain-containing protein [Thaumasiovibrio subtropicus]|uniref:HD-GYP domain-containing protein n=1 Tax=Thaumasiovibrio subtropicus TaxID=1891207 RepID=UPI000B35E118|nr:HD-GYP domain-containing protein [Thaumasiovibrio subtropicus]
MTSVTGIKIAIERVCVGLYVRLPLSWSDHPFLLNQFKIKDEEQLKLIRGLNINYLYLIPEKSDCEPLPISAAKEARSPAIDDASPEMDKLWQEKTNRIERLKNYKRQIQRCEKNYERSLAQLRSVVTKIKNRPVTAVEEADQLVDSMVEMLLSTEETALHLMNDRDDGESIYFHSLNVAVLAMMLAKAAKMNSHDIKIIGLGALFHDIGKLKIPTAITRKTDPLTDPELNYLKLHTKYGVELASLSDRFPDEALPILEQHHELIDGSGYPQGLKGDDINPYAKLVAVVNAYDNLCHPQNPKKQRTPFSALSFLFKKHKEQYHPEYLNLFVKMMGVYPPGSVVQLSNQQLGMVISVNSNKLLFPNILLYDPSVPSNEAPILDLEHSDMKIERAIPPNKLPDKVYNYLNPRVRVSYYFDPNS